VYQVLQTLHSRARINRCREPVDLEELRDLKGIGPKTTELYGEHLINLIIETEEETEEE